MSGGGYGGQFPQQNFGSRPPAQPQMSNEFQYQPRGGLQYQPPQQPDYGSRLGAPMDPLKNAPGYGSRWGWPTLPLTNPPTPPQLPQAPGQDSAPGFMVNQRADGPMTQGPQSLATTGDTPIAGMSAAALNDPNLPMMYRKQMQEKFGTGMPMATNASNTATQPNFWGNVGPGGTANPYPSMGAQPFNPAWGNQTFNFDPRSMAGKQVTGDLGWYYGRDAIGRTINNQGDAVANFGRPADGYQRTNPWQRG